MPKKSVAAIVFSPATLAKFEAAAASVPMRQLDRPFAAAGVRLGNDPGGAAGARRVQFRRYIASLDQHDPRDRDRLADVLGALIGEVADSKQDYLINAATSDGFAFTDGTFTASAAKPAAADAESPGDLVQAFQRGVGALLESRRAAAGATYAQLGTHASRETGLETIATAPRDLCLGLRWVSPPYVRAIMTLLAIENAEHLADAYEAMQRFDGG